MSKKISQLTEGTSIEDSDKFVYVDGSTTKYVQASSVQSYVLEGLELNISDDDNIGFGVGACDDITSGDYNLCFGANAGTDITEGSNNIAIGSESGANITTGSDNICIGESSGLMKTTSSNDVIIGSGACQYSGGSNVVIGTSSGGGNTAKTENVVVGAGAGPSMEGDRNVLAGYYAGYDLTSGDSNIFIGDRAGQASTTCTGPIYIGDAAGSKQTTNSTSILVGYKCGEDSTGAGNTAIGYTSMRDATSANYNTTLGSETLYSLTTGDNNTALGYQAGYSSADTDGCVYLGYQAGYSNITDNLLYIENSNSASPLIWGDFTNDEVVINGNSTDNSNDRNFYVNGSAGGDGAWNNDSDRRLKENIETIPDALEKVKGLTGVNFEWTDNREPGKRIGLIAQDVEKVLPEVVTAGEVYSLQYGPIVALLVEAIKEQQAQIEELKKKIS